jgi:hypothetical protein
MLASQSSPARARREPHSRHAANSRYRGHLDCLQPAAPPAASPAPASAPAQSSPERESFFGSDVSGFDVSAPGRAVACGQGLDEVGDGHAVADAASSESSASPPWQPNASTERTSDQPAPFASVLATLQAQLRVSMSDLDRAVLAQQEREQREDAERARATAACRPHDPAEAERLFALGTDAMARGALLTLRTPAAGLLERGCLHEIVLGCEDSAGSG